MILQNSWGNWKDAAVHEEACDSEGRTGATSKAYRSLQMFLGVIKPLVDCGSEAQWLFHK